MGSYKRVPRCYHCGMVLQCTNPNEKGYVNPEVLNRKVPVQIIYCDSCYNSMIELNANILDQNIDEDVLKILDDAVATDALIVWVVDLFSFNGLLNKDIAKKVSGLKVAVIATKRDLFVKADDKNLTEWVRTSFASAGINPVSIRLIGNNESIDGKALLAALNKTREGHDVYMIGNQSCGKTSLINKVMKSYVNKSKREIKSELYPETNVKVLEVPLTRSAFFYELPGISQSTSVIAKVEKDLQKMIMPKKSVKIITKALSAGEALVVGSLVAFEIVKGKTATYKFFSSESVEAKKVLGKNVHKTIIDNYSSKDIRPVSNRFSTFRDYDLYDYTMENDGKHHDLIIEGLGWLSFIAKGQVIRVQLPKGTALNDTLAKVL